MNDSKEYLRQVVHILYWPLLIFFFHFDIISFFWLIVLLYLVILCIEFLKMWIKIPIIYNFAKKFEREEDFKAFPGKGFFYFTFWALLTYYFFDKEIASASILILCILDSISTLIWRKYWKTKWPFNKIKSIEWSFFGFITAAVWASLIINPVLATTASFVAMVTEAIDIKIVNFKLNDNLTIPLASAIILKMLS